MNTIQYDDKLAAAIELVRQKLGSQLLILGHYYQRDEVLRHADVVGDSLVLARHAAAETRAERIVFCGVHFMAEAADILAEHNQTVYMPDSSASCPMAGMAPLPAVEQAWSLLQGWGGDWLPVAYINSTAEVKAFCGRQGGSICTSSNAASVFQWVESQKKRIFFMPDEHLGTNTAHDLGWPDEAVVVYDPDREQGGLTPEALAQARVLVWRGYCHVHQFTVADLEALRGQYPSIKIVVHSEVPKAVTRLVDAHGSTAQIIRYVARQPAGTTLAIGTELRLVERLAREYAGRYRILPLRAFTCQQMAMTNEANLLLLLQQWSPANIVRVPAALKPPARAALNRMLSL